MKYPLAERFKAPQGEGQHAGVPMAFMRMVGCSVGQGICTACDTEFDRMRPDLGGGSYEVKDLIEWAWPFRHVCITGGEPLDRDLRGLLKELPARGIMPHIETSGTKHPEWLDHRTPPPGTSPGVHAIGYDVGDGRLSWRWAKVWVTVSPKPGFRQDMIDLADEVKVILGGLGDGPGWPTLEDAIRWADAGKLVYVQPRNHTLDVNMDTLREALRVVADHPQLRLSVQLHKFIRTR